MRRICKCLQALGGQALAHGRILQEFSRLETFIHFLKYNCVGFVGFGKVLYFVSENGNALQPLAVLELSK